ncbi:DUF983 domain-containing protein [Kaistia dalseonensis]|uniref:Uncharacterized protein (DUF983 family) n=1 Tax=Kaistia dalseonensis TaxID=410840 RepID=A0ABU0H6W3_9HYPH|nr:DUF983 domain-containing protein [Kaistia dalseonensis]MCX5495442.1 DUF983 domain-containing protein [Kaistia dalseonensis]MDQ0438031.1 uncharacterized protein (DUF983 family) [Kaistia dalseonensis]
MTEWTGSADTRRKALPQRSVWQAMRRGFACRCPNCGRGKLFKGYLTVVDRCEACGEDLSHQRADDAPPYFTILVVGHIVVPLMLIVETTWHLSNVTNLAIWLPLTLILTLGLLRPIKGSVVGLQWALYMHGFDPSGDPNDPGKAPWQADLGS